MPRSVPPDQIQWTPWTKSDGKWVRMALFGPWVVVIRRPEGSRDDPGASMQADFAAMTLLGHLAGGEDEPETS